MTATAMFISISNFSFDRFDAIIVMLALLNIQFYNYAHRDDAAIRANERRFAEWAKRDEDCKRFEAQSHREQLIRVTDFFAGVGKPQLDTTEEASAVTSNSERPKC